MSKSIVDDRYSIILEGEDREPLEELAKAHGYWWGKRGNVKAFLKAIASQDKHCILLSESEYRRLKDLSLEWNHDEIRDLIVAIANQTLQITGHRENANIEEKVLDFIDHSQPFRLAYVDASARAWEFNIYHARRIRREAINGSWLHYLEVWAQETEGNLDIPELQHNWSLRFDRIKDAVVVPIEGKWRKSLDTVEVEFLLTGSLAYAYWSNEDDVMDMGKPTQAGGHRSVKRAVSNTFWLIREVLTYGKDCLIVSPDPVKEKLVRELQQMQQQYQK
jgi:vacuolar-type H+-ATPase subunit F/Vma7